MYAISRPPTSRIGSVNTAPTAAAARLSGWPSRSSADRVRLAEAGNADANAPATFAHPCATISRRMAGRDSSARTLTSSSSVPSSTMAADGSRRLPTTDGRRSGSAPGGQPAGTSVRSPTSGRPAAASSCSSHAMPAAQTTARSAPGKRRQRRRPAATEPTHSSVTATADGDAVLPAAIMAAAPALRRAAWWRSGCRRRP